MHATLTTLARIALLAAALGVAPALTGCAVDPAVDTEVGTDAAKQIIGSIGLVRERHQAGLVVSVGQRLVAELPEQPFDYRFGVLDESSPNAFALPGGYVFVTRGLLALTNDEQELANIIAHEIAHVHHRHAIARVTRPNPLGLLALPGDVVGTVLPDVGAALSFPCREIDTRWTASYNQSQELEADRIGQALAAKAGYDPGAMPRFLDAMERFTALQREAPKAPGYASTHPPTPSRVAEAKRRAAALESTARPPVVSDRARYLALLDGLVLGDDPSRGVFSGAQYRHPDLAFSITMPSHWRTAIAAQGVGAIAPQQNAFLLLLGARPGDDPSRSADEFARSAESVSEISVLASRPLTINGLKAHEMRTLVTGRDGGRSVLGVMWIAHQGLTFEMMSVTDATASTAAEHDSAIRESTRSFRPLTVLERTAFEVTRLRIVEARAGETLTQLSDRVGNAWSLEQTAIANGKDPAATLEAGERIKVAITQMYQPREVIGPSK